MLHLKLALGLNSQKEVVGIAVATTGVAILLTSSGLVHWNGWRQGSKSVNSQAALTMIVRSKGGRISDPLLMLCGTRS